MTNPNNLIPGNRRITVSAKHFYAAWQFVSTEKTRYYLNGVYIEPHKDGGVLLIATDGHSMAVIRDATARFEGDKAETKPKPANDAKPVTAGPPPKCRPVVGLKTAPVTKPNAA
ncbi:hypothetical protein [Thalassospira xiamenensis]|uniref:DNA polymerase III subunit beta family protein n=1 Tax=Thalassospira xiamenensis TaxID=220697 RepID=UPI000E037E37|nr:hypothetical protein [Thalassospira xiamenensis]RCK40460.1 hypothetical protein TH24_11005 [Thalassospira xiamenensis]